MVCIVHASILSFSPTASMLDYAQMPTAFISSALAAVPAPRTSSKDSADPQRDRSLETSIGNSRTIRLLTHNARVVQACVDDRRAGYHSGHSRCYRHRVLVRYIQSPTYASAGQLQRVVPQEVAVGFAGRALPTGTSMYAASVSSSDCRNCTRTKLSWTWTQLSPSASRSFAHHPRPSVASLLRRNASRWHALLTRPFRARFLAPCQFRAISWTSPRKTRWNSTVRYAQIQPAVHAVHECTGRFRPNGLLSLSTRPWQRTLHRPMSRRRRLYATPL